MALVQKVVLSAGKKIVPATVHMVQGDTGRVLVCEIADYTIPSGATAVLLCRRPTDTFYAYTGAVDATEQKITFTMSDEEGALTSTGVVEAQVRLTVSDQLISTFDLHIVVHPSQDGTPQPEERRVWEDLRDEILEAQEDITDLNAAIENLDAEKLDRETFDTLGLYVDSEGYVCQKLEGEN